MVYSCQAAVLARPRVVRGERIGVRKTTTTILARLKRVIYWLGRRTKVVVVVSEAYIWKVEAI